MRWIQLAVVVLIVLFTAGICIGLLNQVRAQAARMESANNMKFICMGLHAYHDAHKQFPPPIITDKVGNDLYSWRVAIYGYAVADRDFWREFRRDEPWDSAVNKKWATVHTYVYNSPISDPMPGMTCCQVFVGPGTAFEGKGTAQSDFSDGIANTLLLPEARDSVPWTSPKDLAFHPDQPLALLGPQALPPTTFLGLTTYHPSGFHIGMADGHVKYLLHPYDEPFVRSLVTRNGGEEVVWPE